MSKIDIDAVAQLANLPLTPEEKVKFQPQLENIVKFIDKLNELDTTSVPPTYQVTGKTNQTRADRALHSLSPSETVKNARQNDGKYIITKGVFDEQ